MSVERSFFGAMNTKNGFVSFFDQIFYSEGITERYIIKGGPGTGKSSFMRRIAARAAECGHHVEYYYCSSDTGSLDGIIIDGKTAFLDGTAPHSCDTVLPGACDEIINLGAFWSRDRLQARRDEIARLGRIKKSAFDSAYGYLEAAGAIAHTLERNMMAATDMAKMKNAAQRICPQRSGYKSGHTCVAQTSAHGREGKVFLDTLQSMAKSRCFLCDYYGTAGLFMREILQIAERRGLDIRVSYSTLDAHTPEEIYFCDSGTFIGSTAPQTSCVNDKYINMKRFVMVKGLADVRHDQRAGRRLLCELEDAASRYLRLAGDIHGRIEEIYVSCMDFAHLEEYFLDFSKSLALLKT